MELKKIILEILIKNQESCKIGSDGDYTSEQCIFAWDFDLISEEIEKEINDSLTKTKHNE